MLPGLTATTCAAEFGQQDCPISETIARSIVSLPCYPDLKDSEVDKEAALHLNIPRVRGKDVGDGCMEFLIVRNFRY